MHLIYLVIELEEGYHIYPIEGLLLWIVGGHFDLLTFSLHSIYKRSHSHCLVDLLIVESEATRKEFPPNFYECSDMFPEDLLCMSPICDLSSR